MVLREFQQNMVGFETEKLTECSHVLLVQYYVVYAWKISNPADTKSSCNIDLKIGPGDTDKAIEIARKHQAPPFIQVLKRKSRLTQMVMNACAKWSCWKISVNMQIFIVRTLNHIQKDYAKYRPQQPAGCL